MKKIVLLAGAAMMLYVIVSSSSAGEMGSDQSKMTDADGLHEVVYIVREENDRVVVYRDDSLFLTTDTPVSLLPKSDRTRLKNGIVLYSDKELKALIEDICS
jgi:hypothetical protein